jgi:hypothetical protein
VAAGVGDRQPRGQLRDGMKARAALLGAALVAVVFLFSVPAGAAPSVGHIAVSNAAPARASTIDVASSGWRPGAVVSISLSGTVLDRATADAAGAVRAEVSIPDHAPRLASLAVVGSAASGVPQQVVTNLTVVGPEHGPAPRRPWTTICLVLALATALLLVSVRTERTPSGPFAAAG